MAERKRLSKDLLILTVASIQLKELLKPGNPPDAKAATRIVSAAMRAQRQQIVRQIRAEARRAATGQYPAGARSITYAAGMRRAAVVAEKAGESDA